MRRTAVAFWVVALTGCAVRKAPPPPPFEPTATPPPVAAVPTPAPVPSPPVPRPLAVLNGTVTYRQRVALTPEAEIHVELRDVTPDMEEAVLAKKVITRPGQVPVAFSLDYDPERIAPGHVYVVSARIADRGQLAFVTDSPVVVSIGDGPPAVEIVVGPVR